MLAAEDEGAAAKGLEAHPFVSRVAGAKLHWRASPAEYHGHAMSVLEHARRADVSAESFPPLIHQCYDPDALLSLAALRQALGIGRAGSPVSELVWLTLVSILRDCASVNAAQCTYILPDHVRRGAINPLGVFRNRASLFAADMAARHREKLEPPAEVYRADARKCEPIADGWADLVITSPPYANNYDYADATRLEMCFFQEIRSWGDLQTAVRQHLVRSCSQHVGALLRQTDAMLDDPQLQPIADELREVCRQMVIERGQHGGKKNYHTMIVAYFTDMARVWQSLRRVVRVGGRACFVIGDSAPYGIYVPVDRWMGELALAAGFRAFSFEKTRDRNVKWKNRKHRVPLHEGRLWVEG
jgi:hypothetical protein